MSHWEAHRGKPSMNHLRQLALLTGVQFEWLATGHGPMELDEEEDADIPALFGEPGIDPGERELLRAFRAASRQSRAVMLELAHQLATPDVHRRRMPPPRRCDFGLLPAEPLAAL